jgi:phosphate/sulfate permease
LAPSFPSAWRPRSPRIINPSLIKGNTGTLIVLAALVGAILWNLITWYFSMPSSSSHALIGGVIGATLAAAGSHAVSFHALAQDVLAPAILSPFICLLVAALGTFCAYRLIRQDQRRPLLRPLLGQVHLCGRHRRRHLHRRVADHQHDG